MRRVLTVLFVLAATACMMQGAITTLMTLSDGTNSVSIDQNGNAVCVGVCVVSTASGSGPHGTIVFIGSIGTFSVNVTTGRGGAVEMRPALINLNSIDVESTGAGNLTLGFTDTGFTDLASVLNFSASLTDVAGTPLGSSVSFSGFASAANAIPATTLIGTLSDR